MTLGTFWAGLAFERHPLRDIWGSVLNRNPVVLARIEEPDTFHADQRNGADVQNHVRTRGLDLLPEFIEMLASQVTDQLQNYLLPECVPINPKCHDFGLRATARRTARSGQQVGTHPRRGCGSLCIRHRARLEPVRCCWRGPSNRCYALSLP